MFENPRRGRQARNFTTNVPKILVLKSSSEQIFSRKLPLGAPDEYWRQVAAATNRFVYTREFLWKSLSLQQNFVVTTGGTNSVWFDYFATCCSDKILLWRQRFSQTFSRPHQAICRYDVTPQRVVSRPTCTQGVIYRHDVSLQLVA